MAFRFLSIGQHELLSFVHSQTFHNCFSKGMDTASAVTNCDAAMRTDTRLASAVFVALATFALSGCGADDSASASVSSSPSTVNNVVAQKKNTFEIVFANSGSQGAPFYVYSTNRTDGPLRYTVEAAKSLSETLCMN
ncbi:hypothetical protein AYM40_34825 [Paraburkholderia phytofirmans OLGA172]|uniref:Bacterial phospholipase C C-terminal domain-containing protein n=1 Tax=Paraburkholderia phytofirmans OLGA172 TaxID=1417228 RepID=A0A160FWE2_9BURK|nr:hypothetical protein AYM40_34825 [Paraburkholderia phytofirmans OLGA172]